MLVFCVCASTDAHLDKDNAKVGLFIAAAMGTFALMAAVYCIYNKFYTKQQYLHTQLNDDSGRLTFFLYIFSELELCSVVHMWNLQHYDITLHTV